MTEPATELATEPAYDPGPRAPMPRLTIAVLVFSATVFVYGLGMAVGGHEWHQKGAFQPGIALIVCAFLLAIPTALMYLSYCHGWNQRALRSASIGALA